MHSFPSVKFVTLPICQIASYEFIHCLLQRNSSMCSLSTEITYALKSTLHPRMLQNNMFKIGYTHSIYNRIIFFHLFTLAIQARCTSKCFNFCHNSNTSNSTVLERRTHQTNNTEKQEQEKKHEMTPSTNIITNHMAENVTLKYFQAQQSHCPPSMTAL